MVTFSFTVGAKDSLISAEVRNYQLLLRNIFQVILQKNINESLMYSIQIRALGDTKAQDYITLCY